MKKYIILLIMITMPVLGQTKTGSTAAPFLSIGMGPRAISMGGAYIATADDITALYWNPAGAAASLKSGAMFSHSEWIADIGYNWAGGMLNLGGMGTVGLSVTQLDYGEMELTTLRESEGTGEMFGAQDLAISLTYAYNLTDIFAIGANFKYVNQTIWNSSASAFAVDLGILFKSDLNGLRIGATISNFGTDMQMDGKDLMVLHDIDEEIYGNNDQILAKLRTDKFPLPLTFKVGLAMEVIDIENHRITAGVDAQHPNDNAESLNAGIEYAVFDILMLRGGYKSLFLENTEEGMTLGFGINYYITSTLGIVIDYAYQDFGIFKETQHFSLGITF